MSIRHPVRIIVRFFRERELKNDEARIPKPEGIPNDEWLTIKNDQESPVQPVHNPCQSVLSVVLTFLFSINIRYSSFIRILAFWFRHCHPAYPRNTASRWEISSSTSPGSATVRAISSRMISSQRRRMRNAAEVIALMLRPRRVPISA